MLENEMDAVPSQSQPVLQDIQQSTSPKVNYLLLSVVAIVGFSLFGAGGYYLGRASQASPDDVVTSVVVSPSPSASQAPTSIGQLGTTESPISASTEEKNDWQSYTNGAVLYKVEYPMG